MKKLKKPIVDPQGRKIIGFASQKKIAKMNDFVQGFLYQMFKIKGAWVSDDSSLTDFELTKEKALKKIKKLYGVDVSDIKGLYLHKIAARLIKEGVTIEPPSEFKWLKVSP